MFAAVLWWIITLHWNVNLPAHILMMFNAYQANVPQATNRQCCDNVDFLDAAGHPHICISLYHLLLEHTVPVQQLGLCCGIDVKIQLWVSWRFMRVWFTFLCLCVWHCLTWVCFHCFQECLAAVGEAQKSWQLHKSKHNYTIILHMYDTCHIYIPCIAALYRPKVVPCRNTRPFGWLCCVFVNLQHFYRKCSKYPYPMHR